MSGFDAGLRSKPVSHVTGTVNSMTSVDSGRRGASSLSQTSSSSLDTSDSSLAKTSAGSLETVVQQVNKKLYPQGLEAVFAFDGTSRMTWINVVNKATGQVVQKWPPEKIRQLVDQTRLLVTDKSSHSFDIRA